MTEERRAPDKKDSMLDVEPMPELTPTPAEEMEAAEDAEQGLAKRPKRKRNWAGCGKRPPHLR